MSQPHRNSVGIAFSLQSATTPVKSQLARLARLQASDSRHTVALAGSIFLVLLAGPSRPASYVTHRHHL
jgi:hypothetical protein